MYEPERPRTPIPVVVLSLLAVLLTSCTRASSARLPAEVQQGNDATTFQTPLDEFQQPVTAAPPAMLESHEGHSMEPSAGSRPPPRESAPDSPKAAPSGHEGHAGMGSGR